MTLQVSIFGSKGLFHRLLLAIAALMLASSALAGPTFQGRVVGIHDGDTLTLLTADKRQLQIRLADIDAPELGQAFGNASKKTLSELCFGKQATVEQVSVDQYGRIVGKVTCSGSDASQAQLERGMAWAYRDYLTRFSFIEIEERAKSMRTGLWIEAAQAPWVYRSTRRQEQKGQIQATAPTQNPSRIGPATDAQTPDPRPPADLSGMFEHHKSISQILEERGHAADALPSLGGSSVRGGDGTVHTGPRGGRYTISPSGSKVYQPKGK